TTAERCAINRIVYKEVSAVISGPDLSADGPHTLYVTVSDTHGNRASGSFSVTVTDNEIPSVNVPANIAVNNDSGLCSASVAFAAIGSATCGVGTIVSEDGATVITSAHVFAVGPDTVDVPVTDIHGYTA